VCALLGAPHAAETLRFLDLIVNIQAVFGGVSASPGSFARAVEDLGRLDREVIEAMIERAPAGAFRQTIPAGPGPRPKIVHVLAD